MESARRTTAVTPTTTHDKGRTHSFARPAISESEKDAPWPMAKIYPPTKRRQRCAPLGLMVIAPDYVEGFLPSTSRRKRQHRTASAPPKLRPLQLASTVRGEAHGLPYDLSHSDGPMDSSSRNHMQRQNHERVVFCGGHGSGGGKIDIFERRMCAMSSSSFDGRTCDGRRAGNNMMANEANRVVMSTPRTCGVDMGTKATAANLPATRTMSSTSGSIVVVRERDLAQEMRAGPAQTTTMSDDDEGAEVTAMVLGGAVSSETYMAETRRQNGDTKVGLAGKLRGRSEGQKRYGLKGVREGGGEEHGTRKMSGRVPTRDMKKECTWGCVSGKHVFSQARKTIPKIGNDEMVEEKRYNGRILPLALPGEAREKTFGAAARAVVLVSGSSRFLVSRHGRGRTLSSSVRLPWVPPLQPPGSTIIKARPNGTRPMREGRQQCELHYAATEVQRVWRGHQTRVVFWTDSGIGFHALAIRIQRVFRGWRGKILAAEILAKKRARAAALITGLGRGFQGRKEARWLRVCRYNSAAAKMQGHFRARAARRWMEQVALAETIRCAGHIQACWRGYEARRRFHVLGSTHMMEEETLKAVCRSYTGRRGWTEMPRLVSDSVLPARQTARAPALPEDLVEKFGYATRNKVGGITVVRDELQIQHGNNAIEEERRSWRLSSRKSSCFVDLSSVGGISSRKVDFCGVMEGVFGAAFITSPMPSPPGHSNEADVGHPTSRNAYTNSGSASPNDSYRVGGFGVSAVAPAPSTILAVRPQIIPSEKYFVAYGHCLLAGAGTGPHDEAAEEVTADGMASSPKIGDCSSASSRARASAKRRTRGYVDALEVFVEGLSRFPTSTALLYGASLTMQATWFTDNMGASPTEAMFEASLHLLGRAWAQDPDRRTYQQEESYFLAAARIAKRRLLRAETAAEAIRQKRLAEILGQKGLSASGGAQEADREIGGVVHGCLGGIGGEDRDESDKEEERGKEDGEMEEKYEPEEVVDCKKAAAVAALHVALWSQIANGNHDMDLRRAETRAAYRRTRRLYSRALELDAAGAVQEIEPSERTFAALYGAKARMVATRHLRLEVPPHPDPRSTEEYEYDEKCDDNNTVGLADATVGSKVGKVQKELRQLQLEGRQRHQQEEEEGEEEEYKRQQQELVKPMLEDATPSRTLGARGSKRSHAAWRIAEKVIAVVREGTKIILRHSPLNSPLNSRFNSPVNSPKGSPKRPRSWSPKLMGIGKATAYFSRRGRAGGSTTGDRGRSDVHSPTKSEDANHPFANDQVNSIPKNGGQFNRPTHNTARNLTASCSAKTSSQLEMHEQDQRRTSELTFQTKLSAGAGGRTTADSVTGPKDFLRVTVTAWRCGTKLILRVKERDIAEHVGDESRDMGPGASLERSRGEEKLPDTHAGKIERARSTANLLLGGGGSVIVVHENEMEHLFVVAVEDQVANGRSRDMVEATERFRLVSEHFIGKVVLLPESIKDPRYRFSSSRCVGGHKGMFTAGLGRYAAGLPYLEAMRKQHAKAAAREEGARVLQRAFGGLLARSKCRRVCNDLLEVIEGIREQGRRLLEEDVLRQKETDAARHIQGAWKGLKLRVRLSQLRWAAKLVRRCFLRLQSKRAAEKAERNRLEGPEVLTVYHKGVVVSGVPLMLSVLRCGHSYKFVGRDQEMCWAHHGYCYEFEVVNILKEHNRKYAHGTKGGKFMTGRVGPIDSSCTRKIVEMLVARLALVDALPAPTAELRNQHRYKTLVVQTTDLASNNTDGDLLRSAQTGKKEEADGAVGDGEHDRGLTGPGILDVGAEHGRGLRDTRATVAKSLKRYHKRQEKWEESRRKQAHMQQRQSKFAVAQG